MNILKNRVLSPREEMVLDRLSLLVICKASGEESPPGPPPAATRAMVAAKRIVRIRCPDGVSRCVRSKASEGSRREPSAGGGGAVCLEAPSVSRGDTASFTPKTTLRG
jgi:hypothetical protein